MGRDKIVKEFTNMILRLKIEPIDNGMSCSEDRGHRGTWDDSCNEVFAETACATPLANPSMRELELEVLTQFGNITN